MVWLSVLGTIQRVGCREGGGSAAIYTVKLKVVTLLVTLSSWAGDMCGLAVGSRDNPASRNGGGGGGACSHLHCQAGRGDFTGDSVKLNLGSLLVILSS